MVGREGMVGAALVLGVAVAPLHALVQGAGASWRISAAAFRRELKGSTALQRQLSLYLYVLMAQTVSSAGCLRFHLVGQRLARWLLMSQDRAHQAQFHVTHEFLAYMLGVRRVGVTVAAGDLQRRGLIHYHRGELTVHDRAGLEAAASWLTQRRPGWRLVVLDALRPQRVQEAIWDDVAGTPMEHYFANPLRGSIHSFGMAVDVTLIDPQGREVDMGSGFDEMAPASHPALHAEHLKSGVLTPAHISERECLAAAMAQGGFRGIPTEWWHFDHGDREQVRRDWPRVV